MKEKQETKKMKKETKAENRPVGAGAWQKRET
jgi:hypothetical protein